MIYRAEEQWQQSILSERRYYRTGSVPPTQVSQCVHDPARARGQVIFQKMERKQLGAASGFHLNVLTIYYTCQTCETV